MSTEKKTIQERVTAFPPVFQERIYGLRKAGKEFNGENESYEVFCCEQAIVIAKSLKTREKVYAFAELTFQEQMLLVPERWLTHSVATWVLLRCHCDRIHGDRSGLADGGPSHKPRWNEQGHQAFVGGALCS